MNLTEDVDKEEEDFYLPISDLRLPCKDANCDLNLFSLTEEVQVNLLLEVEILSSEPHLESLKKVPLRLDLMHPHRP